MNRLKRRRRSARVIQLEKPFEFEGRTYTELDFNLSAQRRWELLQTLRNADHLRNPLSGELVSGVVDVIAQAAGVPAKVVLALPVSDLGRVFARAPDMIAGQFEPLLKGRKGF